MYSRYDKQDMAYMFHVQKHQDYIDISNAKTNYATGLGLSEIREIDNISINMPFTQQ